MYLNIQSFVYRFLFATKMAETQPLAAANEAKSKHIHQGKKFGVMLVSPCWILAMLFVLLSISQPWFIRTPYSDLSINYYVGIASYNVNMKSFDKAPYSKCNNSDNNDDCDIISDFGNIFQPLWLIAYATSAFAFIVTWFVIIPTIPCLKKAKLDKIKRFSSQKNINKCLVFIIFSGLITFSLQFSVLREFTQSFPYKKYCDYGDYDDDSDVGCSWGSGIAYAICANSIIFMNTLYLILLLISHRKGKVIENPINIQSTVSVTMAVDETADEGGEDGPNVHQIRQPHDPFLQSRVDQHSGGLLKNNSLSCILFCVCFFAAIGYLIILSTAFMPNAEAGSSNYIGKQWNNAQCFGQDRNDGYFATPMQYNDLNENKCSFSWPTQQWNGTSMWDTYFSCCSTDLCQNAYNYTNLLSFDDYDPCLNSLSAITKASCHPLAAQFTPINNNITKKSNYQKEDGIFICGLYCYQTFDFCSNMQWNGTQNTVSDLFTDSVDFCENGLGVQIRSELFTDKCFDSAIKHFNFYAFILFIMLNILFV